MSKLIHFEASPREERSRSVMVANEFLRAYRALP